MAERELLNMALNADAPHQMKQPEPLDPNTRKIESKDSMWKPAPIMGREMTMASKVSVNPGAVNQAFNMGNEPPQQNGSNLAAMRQQIQQIRADNPDEASGA